MADVSPIRKVVKLLEDLKTQVAMKGEEKKRGNDKFTYFCKNISGSRVLLSMDPAEPSSQGGIVAMMVGLAWLPLAFFAALYLWCGLRW